MTNKTVGLYCGADTIVKDPGYLDALQQDAGLNLILTGGAFNLSRELRESAPYVTPEGRQGAGLGWSDDDAVLHRAIELCHARGVAVWFVIGGWHGGGENHPDFCACDLWGRPMHALPRPKHALETGLAVCPSRSELNDWRQRATAEIVQRYDIQGVDITHARNIAPAYLPAWWSCGCQHCQRRATALGYDFGDMRNSVDAFLARLRRLTPAQVRHAADAKLGLAGLQQLLGLDGGLADWFNFRADITSDNLRGLRQAVHGATTRPVVFGSDSFPPSFALLVGHRYADLAGSACDYTSTLISHVAFFVYATLASFADLLLQSVDGLAESDALRLTYTVFGYDHFAMPDAIAGFHLGNWDLEEASTPIADLVEKEFALARALNPGRVPSYPVIKGTLWSKETVRRLIRSAEAIGHEGIIFQGTTALTEYQPQS